MTGIGPSLRFSLGHEDYSPGKPHPACYLAAAKKAGLPPEQCVVFEDSNAGVCAAKDAGAHAGLGPTRTPRAGFFPADLVLDDLNSLNPPC
jgi:beta-phosphoglucomutase-like phosphatase (HAD superfamily)